MTALRGYVLAVAVVGLAAIATTAFREHLQPSLLPFFLVSVAIAALVGGWRAGMLATVLSSVLVVLIGWRGNTLNQLSPAHLLWAASLLLVALLASALNSARRQAQLLLGERDSRLRLVSEQIPAGLWSTDTNLRLTTLFGAAFGTMAGKVRHLADLFPDADAQSAPIRMHHRALAGQPSDFEMAWHGRTFASHVEPLRNAQGQIIGTIGVALDITERKRVEQRLKEAKAEAEQATQARDRFLAMLSHELRTPLTPALAATTALEEREDLDESVREDLGLIRRSIQMEAALIDDLLDLTRVASSKLHLNLGTIDAHDALRSALEICRPDLEHKNVELALDTAAQRSHIHGDSARLQQVFWNLIKNAVKFTPPGGRITVRSWNDAATDAGGGERLVTEVSDSGIGIDPEVLGTIFDPFEQGRSQIARQMGGLGLGLAISKTIVEMHGGIIIAHSDGPGRGSTFTVTVPLCTVDQREVRPSDARPAAGAVALKHLRVLLVEDHAETARIMGRLLSSFGCDVRIARSVASALELAAAEPFDILLSDLGLPDGSGHDLMRRLCDAGPIRGIALSGYGMEQDVRESINAGFIEHLIKPIDARQLRAALERVSRDVVRANGAQPDTQTCAASK